MSYRPPNFAAQIQGLISLAAAGIAYLSARDILRAYRRERNGIKVTVIGDSCCDVLTGSVPTIPKWGEEVKVDAPIMLQGGGAALSTACWMQSLSDNLTLRVLRTFPNAATCDDQFAKVIENAADSHGIKMVAPASYPDCSTFADSEERMWCEIEKDRLEWPSGVSVHLSRVGGMAAVSFGGGNDLAKLSDFDIDDMVPLGTRHVHISGTFLYPDAPLAEFIRTCRRRGVRTLSMTVSLPDANSAESIRKVIPLVDFLICSEKDALRVSGQEEVSDAILILANELECNCVAVCIGPDEALLMRRCLDLRPVQILCKEPLERPTYDILGVHEAFTAGLLHQVITNNLTPESPQIVEAVRFACACASAACTVRGRTTFPGLHVVRESLVD